MKISIIIPIYNKESLIQQCVESCLHQDFDDFEVIAVDDGSPDKCGEICEEMAAKDGRLKVFHITNSGHTAARKYGVEHSSGDYITFVDADDELLLGALTKMYDAITKENVDEVIGSYITNKGEIRRAPWQGKVDSEVLLEDLLKGRNSFCVLWGILFRREILQGCLDIPREVSGGEDILTQINVLLKAPSVFMLSELVYSYSIGTSSVRPNYARSIITLHATLQASLKEKGPKYETLFRIFKAKHYEDYINYFERNKSLDEHYAPLRTLKGSKGIPIKDRVILMLPGWLGKIIVKSYRKIIH